MENLWWEEFDDLFETFPDLWVLKEVDENPAGKTWRKFINKAKVRFHCEDCGNKWTSLNGTVIFWYRLNTKSRRKRKRELSISTETRNGTVRFRLYGQVCLRCGSEYFQNAIWYSEEIQRVLQNLYNSVGERYYQFERQTPPGRRRGGNPSKPHRRDLCEACYEGVCRETDSS